MKPQSFVTDLEIDPLDVLLNKVSLYPSVIIATSI
jgi:hypothetical protein